MSYTLLCVASASAAALSSDAEEATALQAMACAARGGWPQSKGADLYAAELLSRAACAWRSSMQHRLLLPAAPTELERPVVCDDAAVPAPPRPPSPPHQQQQGPLGVVDARGAAGERRLCCTIALSTALAHDDLVRAATVAAECHCPCPGPEGGAGGAVQPWRQGGEELAWLLEMLEARVALDYGWFENEAEAVAAPTAGQRALFEAVWSRLSVSAHRW